MRCTTSRRVVVFEVVDHSRRPRDRRRSSTRILEQTLNRICKTCPEPIQLFDRIHRFGRCSDCYHTHRVLEASYSPGYTTDLTGWRACFFDDHAVGQTIRWCSPEKRRCYECFSKMLPADAVARLTSRFSKIDFDVLQPHEEEHLGWTDASSIDLFALSVKRGITLPPYVGYYSQSDMDQRDLTWCSDFRDAWFDLRALLPRDLNPYRMEDDEPCVEPKRGSG